MEHFLLVIDDLVDLNLTFFLYTSHVLVVLDHVIDTPDIAFVHLEELGLPQDFFSQQSHNLRINVVFINVKSGSLLLLDLSGPFPCHAVICSLPGQFLDEIFAHVVESLGAGVATKQNAQVVH